MYTSHTVGPGSANSKPAALTPRADYIPALSSLSLSLARAREIFLVTYFPPRKSSRRTRLLALRVLPLRGAGFTTGLFFSSGFSEDDGVGEVYGGLEREVGKEIVLRAFAEGALLSDWK